MLIALGIAVFFVTTNHGGISGSYTYYQHLKAGIVLFFIIDILMIYILPGKIVPGINKKLFLNDKLIKYRNVFIIKMALIELPGLGLIIFFFLFGDYIILIPISVVFLLLLTNKPSIRKIGNDLSLSNEERNLLEFDN